MPNPKSGEVRFLVGTCAVLAASGVVSAMSPDAEAFLNFWVGGSVIVVALLGVLFVGVRAVWRRVRDEREADW